MKAIKIISTVSLLLIFASVYAGYSGNNDNSYSVLGKTITITYKVNIHFPSGLNNSNVYLVQVVDQSGRPVAQPQVFVRGINVYTFTEKVKVPPIIVNDWNYFQENELPADLLRRTAMLVLSQSQEKSGTVKLYTRADTKLIYLPGSTVFIFNLYPILIERNTASQQKQAD
jgi:hypothetical protein